jgi:hypothetical protein
MVITASQAHSVRVMHAVLVAVSDKPELADFIIGDRAEPFTVSTIEQSVAQSRDRVIFSIGYGRTPHGRVLSDFGSLGEDGGERLLAVAMTRARRSLVIVACFKPDDIDETRMRHGAIALAEILNDVDARLTASPLPDDSDPMLVDLARRLEIRGLRVALGHRGKLGLVASHGGICVAIETDAVLHRASLRESLRLRPELLRRLGWHYLRVHSFELFSDPDAVATRVLELLGADTSPMTEPIVIPPAPYVAESIEAEAMDAAAASDGIETESFGAGFAAVAAPAVAAPAAEPPVFEPAWSVSSDVATEPIDLPNLAATPEVEAELTTPAVEADGPTAAPSDDLPRTSELDLGDYGPPAVEDLVPGPEPTAAAVDVADDPAVADTSVEDVPAPDDDVITNELADEAALFDVTPGALDGEVLFDPTPHTAVDAALESESIAEVAAMQETMPLDPIELKRDPVMRESEPLPRPSLEPEQLLEPESDLDPQQSDDRPSATDAASDEPRGRRGLRGYLNPRARKREQSVEAEQASFARKDKYVPWGEVPSEIAAESAIEDESRDPDLTRPIKPWEA